MSSTQKKEEGQAWRNIPSTRRTASCSASAEGSKGRGLCFSARTERYRSPSLWQVSRAYENRHEISRGRAAHQADAPIGHNARHPCGMNAARKRRIHRSGEILRSIMPGTLRLPEPENRTGASASPPCGLETVSRKAGTAKRLLCFCIAFAWLPRLFLLAFSPRSRKLSFHKGQGNSFTLSWKKFFQKP